MANDLNQCNFIGRLGRDPEIRAMPSGDSVASASIAVSQTWKDKSTGEKREKTEWVNIVFHGPLAKVAGDYLRKGSQVFISGKLQTRKWSDQNGNDRYTTEIRADTMQMLGSKDGSGAQKPAWAPQQAQRSAQTPQSAPVRDDMDDDIPF